MDLVTQVGKLPYRSCTKFYSLEFLLIGKVVSSLWFTLFVPRKWTFSCNAGNNLIVLTSPCMYSIGHDR